MESEGCFTGWIGEGCKIPTRTVSIRFKYYVSHLQQKILISELNEGLMEKFVLWVHNLLGYDVLLFGKTNEQIKSSKYKCDDRSLRNYDFSIIFHRKAEWSEKLYKIVFPNKEVNVEDSVEATKCRILIKDIFQRSLGSFDELMYLAEVKKKEYAKVKIRCRWNIVKSQTLKKCIVTNDITVSFSFLPPVYKNIKKIIKPSAINKIINLVSLKLKPKSLSDKKISKVIFFPHKGVAYGNSYEKDYYYSDVSSSPLNRNNILHLEYGAFDSSIAKSYLNKNLEFDFIKKPKISDLIKYWIFNRHFKINKTTQYITREKLSATTALLFVYTNILAEFLVEYYIKKLSTINGCEFALLGYDVLFPREMSVALHKLNIETIAIQERYTIVYAGNYNVVVDNYLVWSYHTENMIDESIGESFVGNYIVTGPTRSDKIYKHRLKINKSFRKKFVVYSNSPEPNIYANKNAHATNWVIIHALLVDVLELANKFPECDFVIRGKHTGWDRIDYFKDIIEALNQKKNIEINSNYDKIDISYTLLSDAYAIIGHHTSIADEGLCCGIPVLFHDFGPYVDGIYAKNYTYDGIDFFSKSSDDFQSKFFNYFIKGQYPTEILSYAEKTYRGICDGNVLKRIGYVLEEIVGEN